MLSQTLLIYGVGPVEEASGLGCAYAGWR